jgi:hypothetical protein
MQRDEVAVAEEDHRLPGTLGDTGTEDATIQPRDQSMVGLTIDGPDFEPGLVRVRRR